MTSDFQELDLRRTDAPPGLRLVAQPHTRTIDYYLARTSNGSTLSSVVHAWVLARAPSRTFSRRCFAAGVEETRGDVLWLNPYWSQRLGTLKFSLLYRDHYLTLSIADHTVLVRSAPGNLAPIQVGCHGQVGELGNGQSLEFTL